MTASLRLFKHSFSVKSVQKTKTPSTTRLTSMLLSIVYFPEFWHNHTSIWSQRDDPSRDAMVKVKRTKLASGGWEKAGFGQWEWGQCVSAKFLYFKAFLLWHQPPAAGATTSAPLPLHCCLSDCCCLQGQQGGGAWHHYLPVGRAGSRWWGHEVTRELEVFLFVRTLRNVLAGNSRFDYLGQKTLQLLVTLWVTGNKKLISSLQCLTQTSPFPPIKAGVVVVVQWKPPLSLIVAVISVSHISSLCVWSSLTRLFSVI